ncbi:hypothetical protein ACIPVB_08910 [Microbacterium sp. NPDC090007]|uniref:hypothetical protein n=1 Tax=Microbacterium sp. NPDC090007 TaxID=3364204 RepID=UPI0037F654CD
MPVDGVAAANTLLSYRDIKGGYCLFYVWQAYKAHGASTGRAAGTATEGWNKSDGKHPGDRNPPAGVPVWWGPKASSAAGDVTISLGGGRVAATDYPRYGVVGTCTIDERERQIGRPYLGWTEAIFDQPISRPGSAGTGTPFTPEGFLMALSDAQQQQIYNVIVAPKKRQGGKMGGEVTLEGIIQWYDHNIIGLTELLQAIHGVTVADLPREGGAMGGKTSLKAALQWLDQNFSLLQRKTDAVTEAVIEAVKASGATVDESVLRSAVSTALEKALGGTTLDPQVTAKAVRAEFRNDPVK